MALADHDGDPPREQVAVSVPGEVLPRLDAPRRPRDGLPVPGGVRPRPGDVGRGAPVPVVAGPVEVGVGAVPGAGRARARAGADALAAGDDSPEARRVARAAGQQLPPQACRRAPLRDDGQPGLDARLPLACVRARRARPAPVREARRVGRHVGVVAEAPGHEARMGLPGGERRLARAHLPRELARPLAAGPRPRPQKARHARAPPLLGVAVRQARAHVERDHRARGVAVGPRHLVDHVPEPRPARQLVEDPGVAEGEGARAGPPAVLGRVRHAPARQAPGHAPSSRRMPWPAGHWSLELPPAT